MLHYWLDYSTPKSTVIDVLDLSVERLPLEKFAHLFESSFINMYNMNSLHYEVVKECGFDTGLIQSVCRCCNHNGFNFDIKDGSIECNYNVIDITFKGKSYKLCLVNGSNSYIVLNDDIKAWGDGDYNFANEIGLSDIKVSKDKCRLKLELEVILQERGCVSTRSTTYWSIIFDYKNEKVDFTFDDSTINIIQFILNSIRYYGNILFIFNRLTKLIEDCVLPKERLSKIIDILISEIPKVRSSDVNVIMEFIQSYEAEYGLSATQKSAFGRSIFLVSEDN